MALRYFRGRVDLDKLSLSDLADAAGALATLERLASANRISFETGASRDAGPRPDRAGVPIGKPRPKLQNDIIAVLRESGPLNFWDIKKATGMAEGSLSANLSTLVGLEVVQKVSTRQPGEVGRARRENTIYSLTAIACDGAE